MICKPFSLTLTITEYPSLWKGVIGPRHHDTWSTNNTVVLPLHDVIILRKQNDQRGWHWVRSPGWLIVVEFFFGQNVYFIYSPLPPPRPRSSSSLPTPPSTWASHDWWRRQCSRRRSYHRSHCRSRSILSTVIIYVAGPWGTADCV